jgi:hypothetical protein
MTIETSDKIRAAVRDRTVRMALEHEAEYAGRVALARTKGGKTA